MKMEMKKYGKMSSLFQFYISKLGCVELFIKISEKSFFSKFLPAKDILRQRCRKGLNVYKGKKYVQRAFLDLNAEY